MPFDRSKELFCACCAEPRCKSRVQVEADTVLETKPLQIPPPFPNIGFFLIGPFDSHREVFSTMTNRSCRVPLKGLENSCVKITIIGL